MYYNKFFRFYIQLELDLTNSDRSSFKNYLNLIRNQSKRSKKNIPEYS